MAGDTTITLVGNLVEDPQLRFTASGHAVLSARVASTPRTFDKQSGEWRDGESLFLSINAWRQLAENIAESRLSKGQRVIVQGRLKQRSYETRDGEKRTVYEIEADEFGPSLRSATAQVQRTQPAADPAVAAGTPAAGRAARRRPAAASAAAGPPTPGPSSPAAAAPPPTTPGPPPPPATSRSPRSDGQEAEAQPAAQAEEEVPTSWPRRRSRTSTTRTPPCCASSSPSAARSAPGASPA